MSEGPRRAPSADEVIAKIHSEIERRRTSGAALEPGAATPEASPPSAGAALPPALELPRLALQPPFTPHEDGVYHVGDLTRYHDERFVENAYRAILKRMPDPVGQRHHLESLRNGSRTKVDVLGRLRFAPEGRRVGVTVRGLPLRFALQQLYRVPLLGRLAEIAIGIVSLPRLARQQRLLENYSVSLLEMTSEQVNALAAQTELRHREIGGVHGEIGGVRHEISAVRRDLAATGQQLVGTRQDLGAAREEVAGLGRDVAAWRGELERLREELAAEQGAREEVGGRVADAHAKLGAAIETADARARKLADQAESLAVLGGRQAQLDARLDAEARAREEATGLLTANLEGARARIDSIGDVTRLLEAKLEGELRIALEEAEESLREQEESISAVEQWAREEVAAREAIGGEVRAVAQGQAGLDERLQRAQGALDRMKSQASHHELRVTRLLEEARRRMPAPLDDDQLQIFVDEHAHALDALYSSFEDDFRGSRDDIKQRLRVYLPLIRDARLGGERSPVIDLGCGRGEWLELLRDAELSGRGVDRNRTALEHCRERELDVVEADVMDFLASLKDASVGVVTGFHIIEHLPLDVLVRLFDETTRVLRPGGLAIFETPNPANLVVGAYSFYLDPTHRNPLPARAMEFLAEARGLCDVEVMLLNHPDASERLPETGDDELARRFNTYFYAARDYAIVGRRP